ncbi:unnamed protein product [Hymenolepis diminuta]|uniref:Uncharacterized protein n=1 Tax=Hymenolepis diminuta TaxID=6216 RepID=A0A564YUY4_HYMDI|nr:unnamed protein product [Hymenolepis diminuta]
MDMEQNEIPQKNPHERVTRVKGNRGKKMKQHPEPVPDIVNEFNPESKVNAVKKSENGDTLSKPTVTAVFRSSHQKKGHRTRGKKKYRLEYNAGGGYNARQAERCTH